MSVELGAELRVVAGVHDDRHIGMVLRGGADHRRTTDVDILHAGVERRGAAEHLLEGVEIDDEEVDGLDAMREHRGLMLGVFADGEQAAMHFRMEGLEPSIHHFREARQLGDIGDPQPFLLERPCGAARRDEGDAARGERARQRDEPRLVRDREKGARHAP